LSCFFCGATAAHACESCGRFACPRHLRSWLGQPHCRDCRNRKAAWFGAIAVTAGVVVWFLLR
jgi:hypothetical protein